MTAFHTSAELRHAHSLAPFPTCTEDVTADSLLRYLTVQAAMARKLVTDRRPALCRGATADEVSAYTEAVSAFGDAFGVVFMLRQIPADVADAVAHSLWVCWQDGTDMTERLDEWLTGFGIDPDEVAEAARQSRDDTKTTPKGPTHA